MDLVVMPFHDVAKAITIGWGRRDLQLIRRLSMSKDNRVLVINRPTTIVHRTLGLRQAWDRFSSPLRVGSHHGVQLSRVPDVGSLHVLDWEANDVLPSLLLGRAWWPRGVGVS